MDSIYLEVGIGLAVVFFVLATVADGINEIATRTLNTRAKTLWAALNGLLTDATESRPDIGLGFIYKAILPSWLGGVDHRPRVQGEALAATDRAQLVEKITRARLHDDPEVRRRVKEAFGAEGRLDRLQLPAFLSRVDDRRLLSLATTILASGDDRVAFKPEDFYPPLQSAAVRHDLARRYYQSMDEVMPAGPPPDAATLADWLSNQPVDDQLELLGATSSSGRFLTAAARVGAVLGTASVSGVDYIRQPGRRTKVWWMDPRTFGAAVWELAREHAPIDDRGGAVGVDSVAMVENLAAEWKGTPIGNYLATSGVEQAGDVDAFIESVGAWYDGQMERLSLTYRRNVKWALGGLGLVLAVVFNVNAISLSSALISDAESRGVLAAYADSVVAEACNADPGGVVDEADCDSAGAQVKTRLAEIRALDDLGIPVVSSGWSWRGLARLGDWQELAGLAVTAVAVSYGGTFWYDFLKFLTGVRRPS